jgi:hypothetical protein
MPKKTEHECPAPTCRLQVPNALLACHTHWFQLSPATRQAVHETAGMPTLAPARRHALEMARNEWRASQ